MRFIPIFVFIGFLLALGTKQPIFAQSPIPSVYSNMGYDSVGRLYFEADGKRYYAVDRKSPYKFNELLGSPRGTEKGIAFDFGNGLFNGSLYFGLINYEDGKYPQPVYYKKQLPIVLGRVEVPFEGLSGNHDHVNWASKGYGVLGYRVLNHEGDIVFDGKTGFVYKGSHFDIIPAVISGPFVSMPTPNGVTINYQLTAPVKSVVTVDGKMYYPKADTGLLSVTVTGLKPATQYKYTLAVGQLSQTYTFTTAPAVGSRQPFTFAYASDSRSGAGGGERNIYGTNAYIMKKMMATASYFGASFMQFTGDLVTGYVTDKESINLQYHNWKNAVWPFTAHLPVYVGIGNHEIISREFEGYQYGDEQLAVERWPFATEAASVNFSKHFSLPNNGLLSEDGSKFDPNPNVVDFPEYKNTVYYYTYGNVAVVCLNSNYLYSATLAGKPQTSGNLHGYIMDNQYEWYVKTMELLELNPNIDHIFVTIHTPLFPNGGHVSDDMWYKGNNNHRPVIAGKPVDMGIIQRRDQILDVATNKSKKFLAFITGDEHNYNRVTINDAMPRYPDNYPHPKVKLSRTVYQINNGAAGAPYYAQEQTPWSKHVDGFTTRNALVLLKVNGKKISMVVVNPDTMEEVDKAELR